MAFILATLAHLHLTWIHPFGDGNGRMSRLLEFELLIRAGVPVPAAHLLSDHYNKTRDMYYSILEQTGVPPVTRQRTLSTTQPRALWMVYASRSHKCRRCSYPSCGSPTSTSGSVISTPKREPA
ncbi:Fido domain [Actinomyces succiniciruminis]|uniref:Fido domain n=2 Tax=Actinomyces succiniciruminis TaxID=1522002 RepID=A0A1L7RDS3_9ACTO|nr:Fido domain [Actinomyces succiniciruminis]